MCKYVALFTYLLQELKLFTQFLLQERTKCTRFCVKKMAKILGLCKVSCLFHVCPLPPLYSVLFQTLLDLSRMSFLPVLFLISHTGTLSVKGNDYEALPTDQGEASCN